MRRSLIAALALAASVGASAAPAGAQEPAVDATAPDAALVVLPPPDAPDHSARSRDRRGDRDADDRDDEDDRDEDDGRDDDEDDDAPVVIPPRLPLPQPPPQPQPAPVTPTPQPLPTPVIPAPPLPTPALPAVLVPTGPAPAAADPASVPPVPAPAPAAPPESAPSRAAATGGATGVSVPRGPALLNPERLLPRAGSRLAGRRPVLRWRAQRGATVYNLQVFRLRGARLTKVLSAFPRRPRHRLGPRVLRPGAVYVWRVWAYDGRAGRFMTAPVGVSTFRTRPAAASAGD